ncbi:hypothetical protein COX97_00915 [Candidatus Pacearchaeota archaeon CG_4_10_14_0_2_um_filter_05_32_18]|nr:MAG: hypothetical protein AUJ62_02250 [Candidatus Pacearchaeota archaeon CG1_02_32_21]PIZ83545.1 MAG: hypothetical protein COX97_00915 [Candidatus Pacearchaeota archaeon CG_4_10_14_0_2_um_filter_05_32_18]
MKKSVIIIGLVVLIVIILAGGFYFLNQDNKPGTSNTDTNLNSNPEEVNDYVGESTTTIHKDFRAIIKNDWQESEIPPSTYFYLPPDVSQEDVNAEVISIAVTFLGENNQYILENLLEQGIENSKKIMPDFELTENIDWKNKNLIGKKIKFTGTSEGVKRNSLQVFGIEYNNLYAITYSCPIDNCNSYGIYNSLIENFEPVKAERK